MFGQTVGRTIPRPRVCVFHLLSAATEGGVKIAAQGCSPLGIPLFVFAPPPSPAMESRSGGSKALFTRRDPIHRSSFGHNLSRSTSLAARITFGVVGYPLGFSKFLDGWLLSIRLPPTPTIPFHGGREGAKPPRRQLTVAKEGWMGLGREFFPCATLGQRMPLGVLCGAQPATLK